MSEQQDDLNPLLEGCPIADGLGADEEFLLSVCMAVAIVAKRHGPPSIYDALQDALCRWARRKGFTVPAGAATDV